MSIERLSKRPPAKLMKSTDDGDVHDKYGLSLPHRANSDGADGGTAAIVNSMTVYRSELPSLTAPSAVERLTQRRKWHTGITQGDTRGRMDG